MAFIFVLAFGISPAPAWLLIIPALLAIFVSPAPCRGSLCRLYTRGSEMWGSRLDRLSTALFYATPVLYPISSPSPHLREAIPLNPLAPLFDLAQRVITNPQGPWPGSAATGGPVRVAVAIVDSVYCVLAVVIFRREAPRIAEEL